MGRHKFTSFSTANGNAHHYPEANGCRVLDVDEESDTDRVGFEFRRRLPAGEEEGA